MILSEYAVPKEDRGTFVKFMALVAHSDGVVSDEEREAIESVVRTWELDELTASEVRRILDEGAEAQSLIEKFQSRKAGLLLLQKKTGP